MIIGQIKLSFLSCHQIAKKEIGSNCHGSSSTDGCLKLVLIKEELSI